MIDGIDHVVLTVRSLNESCRFYQDVLGARRADAPGRPTALLFGGQKINLHAVGHSFDPKAAHPTPGAGDLCLTTSWPIADVLATLAAHGVAVEIGPVARDGARGAMTSVYIRDPDANLVEISRYDDR